MGPVADGLDWATNLENAHQGAKIFAWENEEKIVEDRSKFWHLSRPFRHKYKAEVLKDWLKLHKNEKTVNNCAKYSCFFKADGSKLELSYIQCRAFYCTWYAFFALQSSNLEGLKMCVCHGISLEICGRQRMTSRSCTCRLTDHSDMNLSWRVFC